MRTITTTNILASTAKFKTISEAYDHGHSLVNTLNQLENIDAAFVGIAMGHESGNRFGYIYRCQRTIVLRDGEGGRL